MKLLLAFLLAALLSACATPLHKPTTTGNAGTTATVAYAAAGYAAGLYFAMPLCAQPPIYPCKTQALNDRLIKADTAAHDAAIAADLASGDATKSAAATDKLDDLNSVLVKPEVKSQIDMAKAKNKNGGAP